VFDEMPPFYVKLFIYNVKKLWNSVNRLGVANLGFSQ
jgi:hypothetical protein